MVDKIGSFSFFTGPHAKYAEKFSALYKDNNKNNRFNSHLYQSVDEEMKIRIQSTIEKIKTEKKKNNMLRKQNQELVNERMNLMNKSNQMIQGYKKSTSFPNEKSLKDDINKYITLDLFIFFKDPLSREYVIDGIVYFFQKVFVLTYNKIESHFSSMNHLLTNTLQMQKVVEPLDWIIRKSAQANWRNILAAIENKESVYATVAEIQKELGIETRRGDANEIIEKLCRTALEILFKCYIITPRIFCDVDQIGKKILFDDKQYECLSEDRIISGTESYILTPSFYSLIDGGRKVIEKARVLPVSFSYPD